MRIKLNLLLVVCVMALAGFSLAQGGAGAGQGAGFGGGRQRGQRGQRGPQTSISGLVYRPDVQADLMLTDEEKGKLDAMKDSLRTPREPGAPRPSAEEMAAQEEAYAKKVEAVLTPDQVKRLHEIRIQLMGARALHLKSVQEDLGLSAEQISKLKTIYDTFNAANASVRQKQQSQEIDRATARADQAKNLEELKTESEKVLTAEQLTKFQGMGGKTFTPTVPAGRGGN